MNSIRRFVLSLCATVALACHLYAATDTITINLTPTNPQLVNRKALGVNLIPWLIFTNSGERERARLLFDDFSQGAPMRYGGGGGLAADTYFWETNVGLSRQPQDFFAKGTQSSIDTIVGNPCGNVNVAHLVNGTDEILKFTEDIGGKGLLTFNAGATQTNGGLWSPPASGPFFSQSWSINDRAKKWAEYVNATTTQSSIATIRANNGRSQPYGVDVFEIGNEHYIPNFWNGETVYWNHSLDGTTYGFRVANMMSAVEASSGGSGPNARFAAHAFEWAKYNPDHINPVNTLPQNQKEWNSKLAVVLQQSQLFTSGFDLISAHLYSGTQDVRFGDTSWYRDMLSTSLEDNARMEHLKTIFGTNTRFAITEHDALYRIRTLTPAGCQSGQPYVPNRLHALTVADKVMNFLVNPSVDLATIWHSGMLINHTMASNIQTVGWIYAMLGPVQDKLALVIANDTGVFQRAPIMEAEGNGTGVAIPGDSSVPNVAVLATVSGSGSFWIASIYLLNRINEDKNVNLNLQGTLNFSGVQKQYVRFPDDTSTTDIIASMKRTVLDPGGGPTVETFDTTSSSSFSVNVPRYSLVRVILIGPGFFE